MPPLSEEVCSSKSNGSLRPGPCDLRKKELCGGGTGWEKERRGEHEKGQEEERRDRLRRTHYLCITGLFLTTSHYHIHAHAHKHAHTRTHGNTDITNTHASQVYTTYTLVCHSTHATGRFVLSQNTRMFLFDFNSYYCLTGLLKRQLNIHHFLLTRFLASGELLV